MTYTGTLAFGTGTDTLAVTAANADVKGATVSGLSAITVVNSGSLTISAAQLATFNGTDSFSITGTSSEVVTVAGNAGAGTSTAASITATEIDFDFTSDNAADVLIGNSGDDNFNIVGGTGVATITGGTGTLDMITTSGADYDATADTITGIEKITLGSTYDISLTPAQLVLNALSSVIGVNGGTVEELKIAGTASADTINLSGITATTDSQIVVTGGAAIDTITASGGTDVIVVDTVATARDSVTSFTTTTDKVGIVAGNTTHTTTAGNSADVVTSTTAASTGGGAYSLTTAVSNADDVIILSVTAAGANSGDLSAATDGTELLKALTDASAADTYTGITATAAADTVYFAAVQGGVTYLYHGDAGAGDTDFAAAEIQLVATFNSATLVGGDFHNRLKLIRLIKGYL